MPLYQSKELSEGTWPDFERLFSQGNGWDHCWCVFFQRPRQLSRKEFPTRAEMGVRNHQDKKELLDQRRARGILVYADDEPVGWCQYGPGDELPGIDRVRKNPGAAPAGGTPKVWRVTCFVVDKKHRRNGVAGVALRAALDAIRGSGGGLVEAYPIAGWTHGREGSAGPASVQGVRPIAPAHGSFGNVSTSGTVSMFEKEGFEAVAVYGRCQVLMRRAL